MRGESAEIPDQLKLSGTPLTWWWPHQSSLPADTDPIHDHAVVDRSARMSAMHDYRRALDRAKATWRPDEPRASAIPLRDAPVFDVVETKWVDPNGSLGSLVAAIKGLPYSTDLVETITLYPPPEAAPKTEDEWLADVAPVLWTSDRLGRCVPGGVHKCRCHVRRTRRSSGGRWWGWSAPAGRRRNWPRSSSRPRSPRAVHS